MIDLKSAKGWVKLHVYIHACIHACMHTCMHAYIDR